MARINVHQSKTHLKQTSPLIISTISKMLNLVELIPTSMVSDAVLGALVGGGAGVLGAGITAVLSWFTTTKRIDSTNKRRRAEFYWEREAESLTNLHSKLEECHRTITSHSDPHEEKSYIPKETHEDEVLSTIEAFRTALRRDGIYLSEENHDTLNEALGQFYRSTNSIDWGFDSDDKRKELKELDLMAEKYSKAKRALQEQINEPIEEFE